MFKIKIASILIVALGILAVNSLHLELSKQFIGDTLDKESKNLQFLIETEWTKENLPYKIQLDYKSIQTSPSSQHNNVELTVQGQLVRDSYDPQPFETKVSLSLVPNPEYAIYKNSIQTEVSISGLDGAIQESVQRTLSAYAKKLSDWTHLHLNSTSGYFYALHFGLLKLARIAGRITANENAVFLYYSSRDLHLSLEKQDAVEVYQKLKTPKPRYLGISLSDKVLDDLVKEFFRRRKHTDLRKFLAQYPDFDSVAPMLKMKTVAELFVDLHEQYGDEKLINLFFNTNDENDDTKEQLDAGNKVTFKKDAAEFLVATSLNLDIWNGNDWEVVRKGFMANRLNIQAKMQGPSKIYYKMEGGIKTVRLLNTEDEEQDVEEGAIKGIINLMLKKHMKPKTEDISELLSSLLCFGFSNTLSFNIEPGFVNFGLEAAKEGDVDLTKCPSFDDQKDAIYTMSTGFYKAEQKKKITYERRQQSLKYREQQQQQQQIQKDEF